MELIEKVLSLVETNPNVSLLLALIVSLLIGKYVVVPLVEPLVKAVTAKSGTDGEVLSSLSDIANERLEAIEKKLDLAIEQNKIVIARFDAIVKASQAQVVTLEGAYDKLGKDLVSEVTRHEYRTKQRHEGIEEYFKQIETFIKDTKTVINFLALEIRSPEHGKDTEPVIVTETTVTVTTKDMPE